VKRRQPPILPNHDLRPAKLVIVEIDRRTLAGVGGEVCWELDGDRHIVTVTDGDGAVRARFSVADGEKARELFEHPFASTSVPDPFPDAA
jgi:hypothetical protein